MEAAAAEGGPTRDTAMGVASLDSEGQDRVEQHGHRVIWMPAGADPHEKRLLVCAHLEGAGHRGVDATMARLQWHCVRDRGKTLPHFTVGDYVLVAPVSRQGKHRKLMIAWTGPWRVANDDNEHVYPVQRLDTAELSDVHVARMRVYADDKLEITGELPKVVQQLENQGAYLIRSISAIKRAASGDEFVVKGAWEGLEEAKSTWEPVSRVFHEAPAVLHKEQMRCG